jgi:hypothetical protein
MRISGFLAAWLLLAATASAQERFDVYFLAVGSGSYMTSEEEGVKGLSRIPGAAKSAKAVGELLERGGSTFGIALVSDETHVVGEKDIVDALSRVFAEIRKRHPAHPLLVFYFAGHGISEGLSWYHFSLPGNVLFRGDISREVSLYSAALSNFTLNAAMLVAWLRDANVPFMVLLDSCYDGTPDKFTTFEALPPDAPCPSLTQDILAPMCEDLRRRLESVRKFEDEMNALVPGFNQMAADVTQANRFETTDPVLFSTQPGTNVPTVPDPYDAGKPIGVAPLARRAMKILTPIVNSGDSISLDGFIERMTSPTLDPLTTRAVTHSPMPKDAAFLLVSKSTLRGRTETRLGSSRAAIVCCDGSQFKLPMIAPKIH